MNWFQAKAHIQHTFKKKHWREDHFISPLAKDIAQYIIYNNHPYYHFETIESIRNNLLQSKQKIEVSDLGAGSKKFKNNKRQIRHLVKYNASSKYQGEVLSRLVSYFKPKNIIELGTSLGLGTLYLALPDSKTAVHTIEGCPNLTKLAQQNFKIAGANNIVSHIGSFQQKLPEILNFIDQVDFVYFDGHHDYQATVNYFSHCCNKTKDMAVFVFDDIYWSEGMAKAWSEIKEHPATSLSFDFLRFGITIMNISDFKEHYVIKLP